MQKTFNEALAALNRHNLLEAERLFRQVVIIAPEHIPSLNLLTVVLMSMNRYQEAEKFIARAVKLDQCSDVAYYNYGLISKRLNKPYQAFGQFTKALHLNRTVPDTWINRGTISNDLENYEAAISDFDRAIELNPNNSSAYTNKGNSLVKLGRYTEALRAYDKALALKPDFAEAWFGRGNIFSDLRRYDEAFAAYDMAYKFKPDLEGLEGVRLHSKMNLCDWSNFAGSLDHLIKSVTNGNENADPGITLAVSNSPKFQLHCARLWTSKKYPSATPPLWRGNIYKHDKIRIGYVSADFREHATGHLIAGTLECHDTEKFETTAISIGPDDNSSMRHRLKRSFQRFIDCKNQRDIDIANEIRKAEIDLLIDLNGRTQGARPNIFAHRPAPIQVNYLGYPGTLGADYIDYVIGDKTIFGPSCERFYSEKLVRLPFSYQPNDRTRIISDTVFTRSECDLPEAGFVFCCFNNSYKILPRLFDCWMRILKHVENSVLWLLERNATATTNLRKAAAIRGISPDRLIFAKPIPLSEHLARHRLANLFLDTLPYNAHTTASDALWAGLPLLTQIGETFAGRVAASLLSTIGLPELITHSEEAYENAAVDLATNRARLAEIEQTLQANRLSKPLFDTQLFTQHLETVYEVMYERYRAGLVPDHIDLRVM
jgi:predicted O-linked N-acetylglucosamine transferase (SPINDLY family)